MQIFIDPATQAVVKRADYEKLEHAAAEAADPDSLVAKMRTELQASEATAAEEIEALSNINQSWAVYADKLKAQIVALGASPVRPDAADPVIT